jgi:hypothetical protein
MLWLRGSILQSPLMNPITKLTANIISAAQLVKLPVLYYFCGFHPCSGRSKRPTITILTSLVLQALEWREEFDSDYDSGREGTSSQLFTQERISEAVTFDSIWDLFVDVMKLLSRPPVIVIDLIDIYHRYGDDLHDLIDSLATLVPDLGSGINEAEEIVPADGVRRTCQILITSKRTCTVLDKIIPKQVRVDVIDSPRWRGSSNTERYLGIELGDALVKVKPDQSLSDDVGSLDKGYVTDYL